MTHFDSCCRDLRFDLPRKSVEPIALETGSVVRTLQEFHVTSRWDKEAGHNRLQNNFAAAVAPVPNDSVGTVRFIDETSWQNGGEHESSLLRQYPLGCTGSPTKSS